MQMTSSVFTHLNFWLLVFLSFVAPFVIYRLLLKKRTISRTSVLWFGIALIAVSGIDVSLLQKLAEASKLTDSHIDDAIFMSLALYLLPIAFGGIGVNMVSHILISHLRIAEDLFEKEHPSPTSGRV